MFSTSVGVSGWGYWGLSKSSADFVVFSGVFGTTLSTALSTMLIRSSRGSRSKPIIEHTSIVAAFEEVSLRPRIAEQMHAAAMADGGVWIRPGSETSKNKIIIKIKTKQ